MIGFSVSGWELAATPAELPLLRLKGRVTAIGSAAASLGRAAAGRLTLAALDSTTLLLVAASWMAGSAVKLLRHLMTTDGNQGQAPACPQPALGCPPLRPRCVS